MLTAHGGGRPAVVGALGRDHVVAAGVGARQPQRQVVRLAAGADQEHPLERRRQQLHQPLGEARHALVQESRVGVQQAQRPRRGGGHGRVAVAEHGHVVDHVQVRPPVGVEQAVAPAPHDLRWVAVVQLLCGGHRLPAQVEQPVALGRRPGRVDADQRRGIRAQPEPGIAQRRRRPPRQLGERLQRQLQVQVRQRPPAGGGDRAQRVSGRNHAHPGRRVDPLEQQPERLPSRQLGAHGDGVAAGGNDLARDRAAHRLARLGEHVDAQMHRLRLGRGRVAASVQARLAVATDRQRARLGRHRRAHALGAAATRRGRRRQPSLDRSQTARARPPASIGGTGRDPGQMPAKRGGASGAAPVRRRPGRRPRPGPAGSRPRPPAIPSRPRWRRWRSGCRGRSRPAGRSRRRRRRSGPAPAGTRPPAHRRSSGSRAWKAATTSTIARQRVLALVPGQRCRRHRGLAGQVAAGHVAEVDQPGGGEAAVAAAGADHVEVGDVAVDDLHAQPRCQPLHDGVVHRHRPLDHITAGGVGHVAGERVHHRPRVPQVPLQDPVGGGMVEAVQRARDAGRDRRPSSGAARGAGGGCRSAAPPPPSWSCARRSARRRG